MRHRALRLASLTALLLVATAAPAVAHVMLMPNEVAPGETLDTEVMVVHGCGPDGTLPASDDEAIATTGVTLEVPAPLELIPHDADGWTITTEQHAELTRIRWAFDGEGGERRPIRLGATIDATALEQEQQLWLEAVQDCVGDERLSWTLPDMEERDGQLPGVPVQVSAGEADTGGGLTVPTPVLVGLAVVLAGGAAAASVALTGRRG